LTLPQRFRPPFQSPVEKFVKLFFIIVSPSNLRQNVLEERLSLVDIFTPHGRSEQRKHRKVKDIKKGLKIIYEWDGVCLPVWLFFDPRSP
jgi:hypothetical protein